MSAEKVVNETKKEENVDVKKREFMGKFGKYAALSAGMAVLMNPTASTANSYGQNNGWGNGDQTAPGNSLENNNAENNLNGTIQNNFGEPTPN
jgi:hypothetical protein